MPKPLTLTKAETPVLWPLHVKSWLIGKDSDAGRDWGQEEKGTTEDEMAEWHHWLDGRESEWTPGVGDGQGGLARSDSWGRKESDTTERLIWSNLNIAESHSWHKTSYLFPRLKITQKIYRTMERFLLTLHSQLLQTRMVFYYTWVFFQYRGC